jgi:sugar/nucleoside kinase (ribokinase family)
MRTPPSATDRAVDLLVVGDVNPDVVLSGVPRTITYAQVEQLVDTGTLTVGGSAAILACGAARLGLRTALVGVIGEDAGGSFMLKQLAARGVDTTGVVVREDLGTGLTVHLVRDDDRAMLTFLGVIPTLDAVAVSDERLRDARHLHASSFFLQPLLAAGMRGLFERAHTAGVTTSLDTNWDPRDRWEGVADVLAETDVLFPNSEEALAIAEAIDPVEPPRDLGAAVAALAARGPLPIVKCGADGATAWLDGRLQSAPSLTAGLVDAVGAGDSFDAGFLAGWLNGYQLERSLRLAAVCGALSLRGAGGTGWQPGLDEALHAVDTAAAGA